MPRTQEQYADLCEHLRPHVSLDGSSGPRAYDGSTTFGWAMWVDEEPPTARLAGPPLERDRSDVRTAGWTNAWRCTEHHQYLIWGTGPRPVPFLGEPDDASS